MGKKPRIDYLELDEWCYIENDEFKIRSPGNCSPISGTWDELWEMVRSDIKKIAEYEKNNPPHPKNN